MWFIALIFSCGTCTPASVALPTAYATQADCEEAAAEWIIAAANPTRTIRSANCTMVAMPTSVTPSPAPPLPLSPIIKQPPAPPRGPPFPAPKQ